LYSCFKVLVSKFAAFKCVNYSCRYDEEYQNTNIMVQDGKEYEHVGDDWVLVEIRDPKQRSEEEKKIVYEERKEKTASRWGCTSWNPVDP
jgi:hypothetical protein